MHSLSFMIAPDYLSSYLFTAPLTRHLSYRPPTPPSTTSRDSPDRPPTSFLLIELWNEKKPQNFAVKIQFVVT